MGGFLFFAFFFSFLLFLALGHSCHSVPLSYSTPKNTTNTQAESPFASFLLGQEDLRPVGEKKTSQKDEHYFFADQKIDIAADYSASVVSRN
jgi:hypothetical protein